MSVCVVCVCVWEKERVRESKLSFVLCLLPCCCQGPLRNVNVPFCQSRSQSAKTHTNTHTEGYTVIHTAIDKADGALEPLLSLFISVSISDTLVCFSVSLSPSLLSLSPLYLLLHPNSSFLSLSLGGDPCCFPLYHVISVPPSFCISSSFPAKHLFFMIISH